MGRSPLMRQFRRVMATAHYAEKLGVSTAEAAERIQAGMAARKLAKSIQPSRRSLLKGLGAAALVAPTLLAPRRARATKPSNSTARIAVVGAGVGGLSTAYELLGSGVEADVYEARERVGGRMFSMGGAFGGAIATPGQVTELGGEFVDTLHSTMRGYIQEFDLETEDVLKEEGEAVYYINGVAYTEADVVDNYRDFVAAMQADLRDLSPGGPLPGDFTPDDEALDYTNLDEYLVTRGASPMLRDLIRETYRNEYGLDVSQQSCLNFLLLIHADKRSKWEPWGVFSDERFHIIGGNQQIPERLADAVGPNLHLGHSLEAASRLSDGRYRLTFAVDAGPVVEEDYDYVIFATPFTVLRNVHLDASLGLPSWKTQVIDELQYGTNSKMILAFNGRPWADIGSSGASVTYGLANVNSTWESNPSLATDTDAILIDYSGGQRGADIDPNDPAGEATAFLGDLEQVFPGVIAGVKRDGSGNPVATIQNWSMQPQNLGAYTCNQPGYFTTLADYEGARVDNLLFAGEHANSFYLYQGWMEGAALSGVDAATDILKDLRSPK